MVTIKQQTQGMKVPPQPSVPAYAPSSNPLAGLSSFMSSMIPPPPPQQTNVRQPVQPKMGGFKVPKPNPQPPIAAVQPQRELKGPVNIDELLKSVTETKSVRMTPPTPTAKKGGSTGKNSVTIKL